MTSRYRLLRIELMKIMERLRTTVFIGLMILLHFCMALFMKYLEHSSGVQYDWWSFAADSTHLLFFVQIWTIVIAGDIISSEFNWGTVKLLLIRPANRTKILQSKYLAVLLFAVLCMIIFWISTLVFGLIFFGQPSLEGNPIQQLLNLGIDCGLYLVEVIMMATLAFLLSTVSRSSSLSIGLTIFLLFVGSFLTELLAYVSWEGGKFLLFANLDLSPYVQGGDPVFKGMTLEFSLGVLIVHFLLFHVIAWFIFKKRDVVV
ncbi:ABC transporter permease [Desmospora activa]|uniref:ABC-2 type transport system permease protein n=1 Tax=Desmospora activa DSM 45169 TaxID=1121389 RepID=A0A2T4ZCI7_9BACL|nr:ABC transporter permease [Desmospora activa]PTM59605.1 ABC-2 type transport system permease protein [Desmospora activa DSM 45169]